MAELDISFDKIQECVNGSFYGGNHVEAENSILAKEAQYWKSYGPHFFPAVIINNVTYRGFLNTENVFQAICNGFKNAPEECGGSLNRVQIIEGLSVKTLVLIIVGIISCNLLLLICYRR